MTFRLATAQDVGRIDEIYSAIHDMEEKGQATIGWEREIYPTRQTAEIGVEAGDMFVMEADNRVVAAARINQEQPAAYDEAHWESAAPRENVLVLHTLVVCPEARGRGFGHQFVRFYEDCARVQGCRFLRMDTNIHNTAARRLYHNLGYHESDVVSCEFNGMKDVNLLCLEKTLEEI